MTKEEVNKKEDFAIEQLTKIAKGNMTIVGSGSGSVQVEACRELLYWVAQQREPIR